MKHQRSRCQVEQPVREGAKLTPVGVLPQYRLDFFPEDDALQSPALVRVLRPPLRVPRRPAPVYQLLLPPRPSLDEIAAQPVAFPEQDTERPLGGKFITTVTVLDLLEAVAQVGQ